LIGRKISHYSVTTKLGEGGMGEVYRATDTRLNREVALKVLPEAFSSDAARMARFQREAQVLASLNHPHIASIYGLEEADGVRCLVLELVEGPTLAERIAKGPIPLDEALPIACQVAEALEAAHERGVVHRDLKPGNIKVTPDGSVKVLDFGLAKAFQGEETEQDISTSPTMTVAAPTQAGIILGTAAYMSPEQARGRKVDRRADIWAFGCVLYEMLRGEPLFTGETVSDVLVAVLTRDPDWTSLPPDLPRSVQRVLRRCLQRDPKRRLRDIGDARLELQDSSSEAVSEAHEAAAPRRPTWALVAALCLAAIVVGGVAGAWLLRKTPIAAVQPGVVRFEAAIPPNQNIVGGIALSPDGRALAYTARGADSETAVWVHSFDSLEPRRLAGTEGARFPFWSPDGRRLGFFANGELRVVELIGGAIRLLTRTAGPLEVRGGTWGADDVIVYAPSYVGGLMFIPASGGEPQPATRLDEKQNDGTHRLPSFLPDGRHFLFYAARGSGSEPGTLCIGEVGSTEVRRLASANSTAVFLPPGLLVFVRGESLVAQRFHPGRLELSGDPYPLAVEMPSYAAVSGHRALSAAAGSVAYQVNAAAVTRLVWADRSGHELQTVLAANAWHAGPELSPDGKRIAIAAYQDPSSPGGAIWMLDPQRNTRTRMTFGERDDQVALWSPDGRELAVATVTGQAASLLFLDSNQPGQERLHRQFAAGFFIDSWFPDGKSLLYTELHPETRFDIWQLPREEGAEPTSFLVTPFNEHSPTVSPDGRWVAYVSDSTGRDEVYVRPSDGAANVWRISTEGGTGPNWRDDGRELYYVDPASRIQAVETKLSPAFSAGPAVNLFNARLEEGGRQYDVAPGGQRFLLNQRAASPDNPIVVVLGWAGEIEANLAR